MTVTEMNAFCAEMEHKELAECEDSSVNEESDNDEVDTEIKDSSNAEEEDNCSESDNSTSKSNPAWADSIAKILKTNKPKRKNTVVLSKAKKLSDVKKTTKTKLTEFEIQTVEGEVKKEVVKEIQDEDTNSVSQQPLRRKKRELPSLRVKPNILEKDRERLLSKIATRGVVQLFNAVRNQQKDISKKLEEAGPLEVKRDKVMKNLDKRTFLDVLMGEKSEIVDNVSKPNEKEENQTWSVLKDDFMMNEKMKDWDKEEEEEIMEYE